MIFPFPLFGFRIIDGFFLFSGFMGFFGGARFCSVCMLCLCFGFLWLWLMTWQAMASIAASSEADWNAMKMRYIQTIRIDFQNSLYM